VAPAAPPVATKVDVSEAKNVVRARSVMVSVVGQPAKKVPVHLPVVEGPAAARMAPNLTLMALVGEDEASLSDVTSEVDFTIVHQDARVLTLNVEVQTMGAYPDSHGNVVTLVWASGAPIHSEIFLPAKRAELARRLNDRVQSAWQSKKRAYAKGPNDESSCGPDVADSFMTEGAPVFSEGTLAQVYVVADGIAFSYDYALPHAVKACTPTVNLHLTWSEASPYLEPSAYASLTSPTSR